MEYTCCNIESVVYDGVFKVSSFFFLELCMYMYNTFYTKWDSLHFGCYL